MNMDELSSVQGADDPVFPCEEKNYEISILPALGSRRCIYSNFPLTITRT